jgi:hypothetical protein
MSSFGGGKEVGKFTILNGSSTDSESIIFLSRRLFSKQ